MKRISTLSKSFATKMSFIAFCAFSLPLFTIAQDLITVNHSELSWTGTTSVDNNGTHIWEPGTSFAEYTFDGTRIQIYGLKHITETPLDTLNGLGEIFIDNILVADSVSWLSDVETSNTLIWDSGNLPSSKHKIKIGTYGDWITVSALKYAPTTKDTLRYFDMESISSSDTLIIEDKGPYNHGIGLFSGEKSTYIVNSDGKVGNCLAFDGVANALAVSIAGSAATNLGHPSYADTLIGTQQNEFTAAMWVKTSNNIAQGWQQIWALGDGEGFFLYLKNNYLTYDAVTLSSDDPWNFYYTRTTATVKVKWTFGAGWNHIATVFDNGALRLYVNNKLVAQDTLRGYKSKEDLANPKVVIPEVIHNFLGSYEGISVGGGYGWKPYDIGATSGWMKFSNFFKGSIDEMGFYNFVLDSAAISALPGSPSGSVGVSLINNSHELMVFPNPSNGKVTIQFNNGLNQNKKLEIYNSIGAKVSAVTVVSNETSIDMSGFHDGMYIFKITEGFNSTIRKIILKK